MKSSEKVQIINDTIDEVVRTGEKKCTGLLAPVVLEGLQFNPGGNTIRCKGCSLAAKDDGFLWVYPPSATI